MWLNNLRKIPSRRAQLATQDIVLDAHLIVNLQIPAWYYSSCNFLCKIAFEMRARAQGPHGILYNFNGQMSSMFTCTQRRDTCTLTLPNANILKPPKELLTSKYLIQIIIKITELDVSWSIMEFVLQTFYPNGDPRSPNWQMLGEAIARCSILSAKYAG